MGCNGLPKNRDRLIEAETSQRLLESVLVEARERSLLSEELLGNLFAQIEAPDGRRDPQSHRGESSNCWYGKFHLTPARWSQINVDGLPCAGSVADGEFQSNCVHLIHVQGLPFQ